MKKWIIAFTATTTILALTACNNTDGDNSKIVVESSAGNITEAELYDAMKERFGEEVLRELVYEKVLGDTYEVTDEELEERVNELKQQIGPQFDMILMQSGFKDEEQFNRTLRISMLQEKAAMENIEVTDEEVQDFYDDMKSQIRASHILVEDEDTAKDIKQKLEDGADFAELAKEYSTDTASAENGGDLNWFGAGKMLPEFEEAAFNLDVDQISDPVETMYGFHIIKVTDKEEKQPLDEIRAEVENDLRRSKVSQDTVDAAVNTKIENSNLKVKDSALKDTFKTEEAEEE